MEYRQVEEIAAAFEQARAVCPGDVPLPVYRAVLEHGPNLVEAYFQEAAIGHVRHMPNQVRALVYWAANAHDRGEPFFPQHEEIPYCSRLLESGILDRLDGTGRHHAFALTKKGQRVAALLRDAARHERH